jgi:predicted nucleotide-binding protein (sugar kinase/HSP70/actin superfamily)
MPIKNTGESMNATVGIPRGLYYYKYFPLWKTFFEEVGAEIAVSPETNRRILDNGISSCVSEACLPVKAWFGHARELSGRADFLFAPRYTSVSSNEYICPKFGGLPDMAKHSLKGLPKLLSPEINMHGRSDGGLRAAVEAGRALGAGARQSKRAYGKAVEAYLQHRAGLVDTAVRERAQNEGEMHLPNVQHDPQRLKILLLGHCYTVGDRFLNMEAARRLATLGADALTLESFCGRALRRAAGKLEKPVFWNFATRALGAAYLLMESPGIADGVLQLTCFGCGVDSFTGFLFERRARAAGIPFATVSLDEHTGEAGLQTRLEAFADTLRFRRAGA